MNTLFVVGHPHEADMLNRVLTGGSLAAVPGHAMMGLRFQALCLMTDLRSEAEYRWYHDQALTRLAPGAEVA